MNKQTKKHTRLQGLFATSGFVLFCTGAWLLGPIPGCVVTGLLLCCLSMCCEGRKGKNAVLAEREACAITVETISPRDGIACLRCTEAIRKRGSA